MTLFLGNLNYSSWSIRALLVARMSGLDIATEILPLATESTRERLLAKTGYKQVPALIDGDLVVRDSLAITEYIAEKAERGSVWPAGVAARARARMAVAEMHSGFMALRRQCYVDIRARRSGIVLEDATLADIARVKAVWNECRRHVPKQGPYLFGAWTAADAFYAPVVTRFRTYGVELSGEDAAYADAVLAHPDMVAIEAAAIAEPWEMVQGATGMVRVDRQG